jgi:cell division cycle 2-like
LNSVYIVLDFLEHDLQSLLQSLQEPFLPSEIKTIMLQLTSAVSYLHSHYILHRDLKTSNILFSNQGSVKLADFGMARYTSNPPPRLTQVVTTLWYRAPELLLGVEEYGFEIDIWSLGCIFGELLTLSPLFHATNEVSLLSLIFGLLGTPTKVTWPGFRSLPNAKALYPLLSNSKSSVSQLNASKFPYLSADGLRLISAVLSLNPDARPTAEEILDRPYFKEDPRPKAKEMMPTFPSKAGLEKRRKIATPQAPARGEAPKLDEKELAGLFAAQHTEMQGGGFALKMG